MLIRDEILEELRKGTPLVEIRRKYRSQSQLYEAIRQFLEEADKIVKERQQKLQKVKAGLLEAEAKLKRVKRERLQVSREFRDLNQAREELSREVTRRTEELDRLNSDITELQTKGFTSEILKGLKTIQERSGPELLSQMETVDKYRQVKKKISSLRKEKASLKRAVNALEVRRRKAKERLVSEKNRLDELKMRTATFKEAVATVGSLFSDGYCSEDIKSLKLGLNMLGIRGDPLLSITRLVKGLSKQKSLASLEDEVIGVREELATLKKELAETKGKLKAAKQVTLRAVEEAKATAVKEIADMAADANAMMKNGATRFEIYLANSMGNVDAHVHQIMAGVTAELGEWGELQQLKGKLRETIDPGLALLGILGSPEVLKKVPLSLVVQLLERLYLWSEMYMQDVSIHPSANVSNKDYRFPILHEYRVSVLIELLYEGLKHIMMQQSRKTNAAGSTSCQE